MEIKDVTESGRNPFQRLASAPQKKQGKSPADFK